MIAWPTINYIEGENPFVTYFKRHVHVKNNCINAVATGIPGTGKSWGMLYLLSQADPTFDIDRVFFKASKMIRWIEQGNLSRGKAFMFDEAGIDASNLSWWDEINRCLNAFFQTGRSSNYICGVTVPFLTNLSKGVRTFMNVRFQADGWIKKVTKMRGHVMEYNGDMDKFYRKRLLVREPGGASYCSNLKLPQASKKLINDYESCKKEFKTNLYTELGIRLEAFERKGQVKQTDLTDRQEEVLGLLREGNTQVEIAGILGISNPSVHHSVRLIKNKGYDTKQPKREQNNPLKNLITPITPPNGLI